MKTKKIIYRKIEVQIEVQINGIDPQPPAYQDTAPRHIITGTIPQYGWVEQRSVSDSHLYSEIDKVEKEAKEFIDKKLGPVRKTKEVKALEKIELGHNSKLTEKGFK